MRFYLGAIDPNWLEDPRFEGTPLFISRNRLKVHGKLPRARTRWALDSGAFTEIAKHGKWTVSPEQYAAEAKRWQDEIGMMDWASIQDWMNEPDMLKKTGKSIPEHQLLTTRSLLDLRDIEPGVKWIPILQGWEGDDYLRHVDQYDRVGIDLTKEPVVGVGSVCRRQDTEYAEQLMQALHRIGIRAHGFGFKKTGLVNAGKYMESADSMAWSYAARFGPVRLEECEHTHPTCEYCPTFAERWRRGVVTAAARTL